MPTLEWIGKDKVINHHLEVPYRILENRYKYNTENESENKIIHGDNLDALKSLLPEYEGKIKCIYIDPPYNTGNEGWVYNDNVSDPKIKKWLGEVVGKEGEDLSRHDKWLCMMYPRLRLLQKLLHSDGCIAISIGFHELHNLVCICKEIFATKQVITVTVQTSGGKPSGGFNNVQEYIVFIVSRDFSAHALDFCGGKNRTPFEGLTLSTFNKTQRPNQTYPIFIDPLTESIVGTGKSLQEKIGDKSYIGEKADYIYDYSVAPKGMIAVWPITAKGKDCVWRQIPDRLISDWKKGYIKVSKNSKKNSRNKYSIQYLPSGVINKIAQSKLEVLGTESGVPTLRFGDNQTTGGDIPTIWAEKDFYTVNGTQLLKEVFPNIEKPFDYPKSLNLIYSIIQGLSSEDDIILDSFAGSGTAAHAVLKLNKEDGGNRKFILVEMEDYADSITAERVRRVIDGYADVEGTGGDFSFYELGDRLLLEDGNLNKNVAAEKIRQYIWFMETHSAWSEQKTDTPYYLGTNDDTAYYFFYEKEKRTDLNYDLLSLIKTKAEQYLIYADTCTLSDVELIRNNIIFRKIPRDITKL